MRVISGSKRGRKLNEFEGQAIRPTTDRVKESMFNLIQDCILDSVVFDGFLGTGALGIESLSRGAKFVVGTDVDKRSIDVSKSNYELCSFKDNFSLLNMSAVDYLKSTDLKFDLVFLDPPYNKGLVTPVLEIINSRGLLNSDGVIVIERDGTDDEFDMSGYTLLKERKYGRTVISILNIQRKEA